MITDKQIEIMLDEEIKSAAEKHGDFNSSHEAYAVILEEVEELTQQLDYMKEILAQLWEDIKRDTFKKHGYNRRDYSYIEIFIDNATDSIRESIQVGAMIKKFEMFLLKK